MFTLKIGIHNHNGTKFRMLIENQCSTQDMPFNLTTTSHRSFYTSKNSYKVLLSKITNN